MKLVSIMLMALMTLFTAAMAVNAAEEPAANETVKSGAAAVANVTEEVKETAANATAVAEEVKEEAAVKAGEVKEEAAVKAGEVKENATEAAEKAAPGFESLFALTGLVGAALLLARRA